MSTYLVEHSCTGTTTVGSCRPIVGYIRSMERVWSIVTVVTAMIVTRIFECSCVGLGIPVGTARHLFSIMLPQRYILFVGVRSGVENDPPLAQG